MTIKRRAFLQVAAAAVPVSGWSSPAKPDLSAWPQRPVNFVVSAAPGGSADAVARALVKQLSAEVNLNSTFEYKGALSGALAAQQVQQGPTDGYTLLISNTASHAIIPGLTDTIGYDPVRDFSHIAILGASPWVFVVNAGSPFQTWGDWLQHARRTAAAPKGAGAGGVSIGTPGEGSQGQLIAQLLSERSQFPWTHIPYRNTQLMLADVVGGHLEAGLATMTAAAGMIRAGRLKPLFVSSARRLQDFMQVPTAAEVGVPDSTMNFWLGLAVSARVDPLVRAQIQQRVAAAISSPDWPALLRAAGVEVAGIPVDRTGPFVEAEVKRWGAVARSLKISADALRQ